jgi:hypothetical protein
MRPAFRCILLLLLLVAAGCNAFQRDAQVSRDQWEPDLETETK